MSTALAPVTDHTPAVVGGVPINYEEVLKALKLNPRDPNVQALVLVGREYELDPVLGHLLLVDGRTYVTHKGLLHVAHRERLANGDKALDGIVLEEQTEDANEWRAKVSVYRKDMGHPFTMVGRYPKSASNKKYGPEMAVTRAECLCLRRAFDIALSVAEEQDILPPAAGSIETTADDDHGRGNVGSRGSTRRGRGAGSGDTSPAAAPSTPQPDAGRQIQASDGKWYMEGVDPGFDVAPNKALLDKLDEGRTAWFKNWLADTDARKEIGNDEFLGDDERVISANWSRMTKRQLDAVAVCLSYLSEEQDREAAETAKDEDATGDKAELVNADGPEKPF